MTSTPPPFGQQANAQSPHVQPPSGQQPYGSPGQQPYGSPGQQPYGSPGQQPYGGPPPSAPYGPPSQPMYGPPQQQPYGAPGYPPPPPLGAFDQTLGAVPVAAWLVPVAALLAVIGACIPWFHGSASANGRTQQFDDSLYSWADGRIGLAPPIVLTILAIGVVALLRGRAVSRFSRGSSHPIVSAARASLIVGVGTLVCVLIAWFLVPTQYKFNDGNGNKISWNDALNELHDHGIDATFSRGPQAGYFLTIAAGVLAVVGGILMLVMRDKTAPNAPTGFTPPGWSAPPPPSGFPPPATPPQTPQTPQGAPADGGWSSPTSYSHEQSGDEGSDGRPDLTK